MNNENLRPREAIWGETKRRRHPFLTDTGWAALQELADFMEYSISETMERIARKELSPEEFTKLCKWLLTKP